MIINLLHKLSVQGIIVLYNLEVKELMKLTNLLITTPYFISKSATAGLVIILNKSQIVFIIMCTVKPD